MNWKNALHAAVAALLVSLPAVSQTKTPVREERVLAFIHQANVFEIEAAKLALANSSSDAVKSFAEEMVKDHQAADAQLRTYGSAHDIDIDSLSNQLDQVDEDRLENERRDKTVGSATGEWAWTWENTLRKKSDDTNELAKLRNLRDSAFDREYARAMIDGHQNVSNRLRDAEQGRRPGRSLARPISPDLKSLIDGLLPTVQHHLEMAQALEATVAKA